MNLRALEAASSMSIFSKSRALSFALVAVGLAACTDDGTTVPSTSTTTGELDVIGLSQRPASLLVLSPTATVADRRKLERTLVRLGGAVLESHPPRLVIAQVPAGADTALTALGVVARFDRAVTAADLTAPTLAEERFLSVYDARWFPAEVPPRERIAPMFVAQPEGEGEAPARRLTAEDLQGPTIDPEDMQPVPFASGTIVVSVVLPESNGAIDPSTENWTEERIRETYLKIQAALDQMAASEPNADLKFVMHYESAPAPGALEGTVDTDYEFGQRAQWGSSTEGLATADIMSTILGREVTENDVWTANVEYTAGLKARYGADAAFFVIVADNGNFTGGLRAHAWIGGPHTVLDTNYGHETFAHEFGHIFGAYDEYCPDACSWPTSIQGYLGIYNANAAYQEGGPGIDNGRGEGAPSLMQYNQPGAINGYTRGAFGWLDTDGDGVVEVRDTFPKSALTASASGRTVRIAGTITDKGDSRTYGGVRYSANRIDTLEYAFNAAGPWFRVALPGDTRGRQAVDVALGEVPAGTRDVFVRAINSVGNVETRPVALRVTTTTTGNSAPHLRLDVPARAGTGAPITINTTVYDFQTGTVQVRYDLDGNGSFDTAYMAAGAYSFTPTAGLRTIRAQARDAAGATRTVTAELPVVSGAAAPVLALGNLPSLVHGVTTADVSFTATAPGATLDAITELATDDDRYNVAAPVTAGTVATSLPTPASLRTLNVDLTAGDQVLMRHQVRDIAALDADHIAVAAGGKGVWFVDITDRRAPRVMSTLTLETSATRLWKHGNRLYVLGTYLTIVNISDLTAPREIKQFFTAFGNVAQSFEERVEIPDAQGWSASHFYAMEHGAKISSARVTVTVDHPRHADLLIRLVPGKGSGLEPVILRDHAGSAHNGLRTYTFTSANTMALRAIHGQFADDYWSVDVLDDVGNGHLGHLVSSRLEFNTAARAVEVLDRASEITGVTGYGDLIVAGAGVQALDVTLPQWVTELSSVEGTGTISSSMNGDYAILAMPLESKNPDGTMSTAPLRGLCSVDFRNVFLPRIVRCETTLPGPSGGSVNEHAVVGGRLYVGLQPSCNHEEGCDGAPFTIVGDASRFVRGWTWRLGTTAERVDRNAIGNASQLWTITYNGTVALLDVSVASNVRVVKHYLKTTTGRLINLRFPEVMLYDFWSTARVATLGDEQNILSRVYRITVEATGAGGAVTRASRTVHVVPYDHTPSFVSAVVTRKDELAPWRVRVEARDPDQGKTWDPSLFARVDFDADGTFDTDWTWMGFDGTDLWSGELDIIDVASGVYPAAVIEVRDGFWARTRATTSLTVP